MESLFSSLIDGATMPEMKGFFLAASMFFAGLVPAIAYRFIACATSMSVEGE